MFVCLSSGSTPRYRDDVLRALSMPWGSVLQFRYDKKWIARGVLEKTTSTAKGQKRAALIAFIDQSDPAKTPELVPCRFASIREAVEHGTTASLQLELHEFAYAEDLTRFNAEMQSLSGGSLPSWQPDKKLKGDYWLEVSPDPKTCMGSTDLAIWEKVVGQLAVREEFKEETSFYTVVGISDVSSKNAVSINNDRYEFSPGREYELQLYHYSPRSISDRTGLRIASTSRWISVTTNPVLSLDSRYDLKRVRFLTLKPHKASEAVISISRDLGKGEPPYLDFDLRVVVSAAFWEPLAYGIILGIVLAGPQVAAALLTPDLPWERVLLVCVAAGATGVIAGLLVAFGLKASV